MGVMSKIGQTLLRAAPYVAAPFTGGASLTMAGTANNLANTWAQKNAQSQYEKTGISPSQSKFDQFASMAGNIGAATGGFGGGFGGRLGGGGGQQQPNWGNHGIMDRMPGGFGGNQGGGGWQDLIMNIMNRQGQGGGQGQAVPRQPQQQQGRQGPIGGSRALQQMDLRTPNLAHPLLQGINQARSRRQQEPVSQDQYTGYNW